MRIRRGRQTRGDIRAMASPTHMDDISQQLELMSSSRGFKQKIQESGAMDQNVAERSFEKAPLELLERLQISSTTVLSPPNRPYMNLDEFVTSLARTNCFPADDDSDDPHSTEDHCGDQHNNFIKQSCCSLTNSSVQARDDKESPDFGRIFGAASLGSAEELRGEIATVETSLRLATPSSMSDNPYYQPANPRTTTSDTEARAAAAAANQADQTMKFSTDNVEQRSGRHTTDSSPGSKSDRNPSPASVFTTDQTDTQEEGSSEFSIQMTESSRKPRSKQRTTPRTPVSISSPTLKTPSNDASEERKQKLGKPIAKRMMKRSGRPKKLKYLQQDNVEELGNQCNRRDGKGWTCPLLAKPGYQLCDHHLDKLRCKPGSRAKYNKSKKKNNSNNNNKGED